MRGGLSPSSGLMCEIVNSVGQRNFTFVRKKSGCGNHDRETKPVALG